MSGSNLEYLQHALDEIDFLQEQTKTLSEDRFMRDDILQRAFARSLEIIGEAIKCISDATRRKYPEKVGSMRDITYQAWPLDLAPAIRRR